MESKIVCIGEVLWDSLPEGLFLGGAPFNVSCHLRMLGQHVTMISRVGRDQLGELVLARVKERGMVTNFIQIDGLHNTGLVKVLLDKEGNATYEIVEPAAWDFISFDEDVEKEVTNADALVFGSLAQRHVVSRACIVSTLQTRALKIFDLNLRPPYDKVDIVEVSLRKADIVKLNQDELKKVAEWFHLSREIKAAQSELCKRFDCEAVCVTHGPHGATLLRRNSWHQHGGFRVDVQDTVGAGDAFLAAFIAGILADKKNDELLRYANAVGAFVAAQRGATPSLDFAKIQQFLHSGK